VVGKIQYPLLKVENCPMLVKHHGCEETILPSVDGSYCQMAKQSHENYRMKMVYDGGIINTMKVYLHGAE
jgi:predicted small secreted protein